MITISTELDKSNLSSLDQSKTQEHEITMSFVESLNLFANSVDAL